MIWGSGIGVPRSKFGRWMQQNRISQEELSSASGVSPATISRLMRDDERDPSWRVRKRLMDAMRRYDSEISASDFWG